MRAQQYAPSSRQQSLSATETTSTSLRGRGEALLVKRRAAVALVIEKAALDYLAKHDATHVTVEQVAKGAGISRRTFYRYFETTDDIIAAMPRRFMRRITQSFRARPSDETLLEAFLVSVRKATSAQEDMDSLRLTKRVRRRSPEAWARAVRRIRVHGAEVLEEIVADRLRALGRDAAPAGAIAAMFIAILVQVPTESQRKDGPPSAEDFERALRSLVESVNAASAVLRSRASPRKRLG